MVKAVDFEAIDKPASRSIAINVVADRVGDKVLALCVKLDDTAVLK